MTLLIECRFLEGEAHPGPPSLSLNSSTNPQFPFWRQQLGGSPFPHTHILTAEFGLLHGERDARKAEAEPGLDAEVASAIKNHHDIMAHWDKLMPKRVLHVPYEQLIEDQQGWSRLLLRHCGLPWDERVLDFHKTERDVQTASLSQARTTVP